MQLSVVIPLHNEADNVEILTGEIAQVLNGRYDFEIICVDDGSADATLVRLTELKGRLPRLRVIGHLQRCGQSTALLTGIKSARAPVIVTMDGDLQNDPTDIPKLVEALNDPSHSEGLGMVAGFRKHRQDTRWRRFSSTLANAVRAWILKDETPDTGCGLKVFYREVFLGLPYFENMHRFLPALVKRSGSNVVSVTVKHRPRVHGRSHYGTIGRLIAGIIDLCGVTWLVSRSRSPIIEEVIIKDE
jgi:glycosyltransferase involved in cell wall biosynthesis